ncbi:MAG: YciI family protein [Comamonadaceae bacterium]|nr:MAG: YciI family protein [Comamonadaceae bacterium]
MRYACLIYYNPQKLFDQSPESLAALAECEHFDDKLKATGNYVTSEALVMPQEAMTVQVRGGKASTVDGPFMETKEMLGGFIVIEARDLNDAVRLAAGHPIAAIGSVEVRPVVDFSTPPPQL